MASSEAKILLGKSALITGASRGIGRAIAAAYADAGARVFICGRNPSDVENTCRELAVDGVAGDIARVQDAQRIVQAALARFGAIDVLVNNASILGPRVAIADYPLATWDDVLRTNLTGLFLITHEVLPTMLARRSGSIINVTSGVGRLGKAKWGAYAVSKAGLEGFTQVLADEVKSAGIRVNSVNPAATRTAMRAQAYPDEDPLMLPTAESVVPLFLYLASDASVEVSGQSLNARDWQPPVCVVAK
ncbi:MAG: SDR family NAD(P)-dependent oxidoreductase [Deltaproteobacteria bacterium]|nr:SDR family NAD(P)-dependent oxidoreductase [Deltaproteobacteria bacterium]